ncbi:peptidylprolyl isomerase [Cohnella herbarum]|uniref:Peptidylprolyl isomerase n=1 Tax=Cohnella herbarum TaxID=2728023 RepID=A0A7Z2VG94_9BACL|nr:peptidylprolyl isomerase [Cohnella herbarum]QJD82319.1 peptidylprolyl isomerase [Cohnella herbarum]
MTERNENELNDKQQQVDNEQIERELENNLENDGTLEAAPVNREIAASEPAAPVRNNSSVVVPWIITVIAIAALVFVLIKNPSGGNETVAKMDGITIKQSDLIDEISNQMGEQSLISLVDGLAQTKIIDMESEKAGVTITDDDIAKEIEVIKTQYGMASDDDLNAALQQSGFTLDDFKEKQIKPQLKIKKLFESQHPATAEDLKAYFDTNKETFATTPKEVRASHILLSTKEDADAVLAELKAGKDFATLAKEKSQDPGSKDKGGDLDFFGRGVMHAEFEDAAFALAKGEMSEVVQSQSGFHIIKLTDVKEAVIPEYDTVKDKVSQAYWNEKMNKEAQAWLDGLKKDKNYENLLAKKEEPSPSASPSASPEATPEASPSASQSAGQ